MNSFCRPLNYYCNCRYYTESENNNYHLGLEVTYNNYFYPISLRVRFSPANHSNVFFIRSVSLQAWIRDRFQMTRRLHWVPGVLSQALSRERKTNYCRFEILLWVNKYELSFVLYYMKTVNNLSNRLWDVSTYFFFQSVAGLCSVFRRSAFSSLNANRVLLFILSVSWQKDNKYNDIRSWLWYWHLETWNI